MNAKTTIRKVLFVAVWLCIGGAMVTLLLAAISNKNNGKCSGYSINIKGAENNLFIDKKDVELLLFKATNGPIKGDPVAAFNLHGLERMLEANTWIENAELYFDNKNELHITISEKAPVARIFTTAGNSFYINSNGKKMPLSDKMSARVPVFTGYVEKKKMNASDSLFLDEVTDVANYIGTNPFWMSQVAQIDITTDNNFEMIPVVGNHLVKLGNGESIDKKFHRLMVFYKQVLSKTGFDKYKVIDVQYEGQVVTSKYAGDAKVDAEQLRKNVEKLMRLSIEAENDTVIKALPPTMKLETDSASAPDPSLKDAKEIIPEKINNPNPLKSSLSNKEDKKKDKPEPAKTEKTKTVKENKPKPVEEKRVPKAVMPKIEMVEDENGGYN